MSTDTVVVQSEEENLSLEEHAAKLGLDENGDKIEESKEATPEAPAEDRPEWLPEKFKSVEDMAKAYSELEAKQSAPEDAPAEAEASQEAAREAVESAGVDYDALSAEYAEKGELGDDAYKTLEDAGIPRELVDQFIAGQQASAEMYKAEMLSEVGGEENYASMTEWASDNFSDGEIDAFNDAVNSGDGNMVRMAIAGLKARFDASVGTEPSRSVTGEASTGQATYRSLAEMMTDMNDPRYATDEAFRQDVAAKLSRSDIM